MRVFGVFLKRPNPPIERIHDRNCHREHPTQGIDRRRLDHAGVSCLEIARAANVETIAPAGLFANDLLSLSRPAPVPRCMRGVRGKAEIIIGKQRRGPTVTIEFAFEAEMTRFFNLARDENLPGHF